MGSKIIELSFSEKSPLFSPTAGNQNNHFFLSDIWLNFYSKFWANEERFSIEFSKEGFESITIAALSQLTKRSFFGLPIICLALNESQNDEISDVTLEVNGLSNALTDNDVNLSALLDFILSSKHWDQFRLSNLSDSQYDEICTFKNNASCYAFDFTDDISYLVNLDLIRSEFNSDYLKSRSSNTRSQLRSALRKCEKSLGPVELIQASSSTESMEWLENMAALHTKRWGNSGKETGFERQSFLSFYQKFTEYLWGQGALSFIKVKAGDTDLAYLFNITWNETVYFAIGGINFESAAQFKPGHLAHWMAIEHYLNIGVKKYDFMVGRNQYKESLCTDTTRLRTVILQKKRLDLVLEYHLRQTKRKLSSVLRQRTKFGTSALLKK